METIHTGVGMYNLNVTRIKKRSVLRGIAYTITGVLIIIYPFTLYQTNRSATADIIFIIGGLAMITIGLTRFKDYTIKETITNVTNHEKELTTQDVIGGENGNHTR